MGRGDCSSSETMKTRRRLVGVPVVLRAEVCCPSVEAAGTRRECVAERGVGSSELLRFGRGVNSLSSAMFGSCFVYFIVSGVEGSLSAPHWSIANGCPRCLCFAYGTYTAEVPNYL